MILMTFLLTLWISHPSAEIILEYCTTSQVYNLVTMSCESCTSPAVPSSTDLTRYCMCPKYTHVQTSGPSEPLVCLECASGYTADSTGTSCVYCPYGVDSTTKDCLCASGEVPLDRDLTGAFFTGVNGNEKICTSCASGYYGVHSCSLCETLGTIRYADGSCGCDNGYTSWGNECYLTTAHDEMYTRTGAQERDFETMTFQTYFSGSTADWTIWDSTINRIGLGLATGDQSTDPAAFIDSFSSVSITDDHVDDWFYSCGMGCMSGGNQTACSCLLNLCAITLYDSTHMACKLYDSILEDSDFADVAPAMYFDESTLSQWQYLPDDYNDIFLFVAIYSWSGELEKLRVHRGEIFICNGFDLKSWQNTQSAVSTECKLTADAISTLGQQSKLKFFELYAYIDGSYFNIPIVIEQNSDTVRYRRFWTAEAFLSPDFYFRYAAYMKMHMTGGSSLSTANAHPELRVLYLTIARDAYSYLTGTSDLVQFPALFQSEFTDANATTYNTGSSALLGFMSAIAGIGAIVVICKKYSGYGTVLIGSDGQPLAPTSGIFLSPWIHKLRKILITVLSWQIAFFIFMSCWWSFGYISRGVATMPPVFADNGSAIYTYSDGFMIYLLSLALVVVLLDSVKAGSQFVLFLDLERNSRPYSRNHDNQIEMTSPVVSPNPNVTQQTVENYSPDVTLSEGSVWRSLFIGQAFCDRLEFSKTKSVFIWISMLLLLQWANWELSCRVSGVAAGVMNPLLQYALPALVWLLVVLFWVIAFRVKSVFFGHELLDLVDVCSLANISILVLDDPTHGWLLHGRAPSGKGDWTASDMLRRMQEEASNLLMRRGLLPDDPHRSELQTFELYLPTGFKQLLVTEFGQVSTALAVAAPKGRLDSSDAVNIANARRKMHNEILKAIEGLSRSSIIRPKTVLEAVGIGLQINPNEVLAGPLSVMTQPLPNAYGNTYGPPQPYGQPQPYIQPYGQPLPLELQSPVMKQETAFKGGVMIEDWSSLGWANALLFGEHFMGFPVGDEWRMISAELLIFLVTFRYTDSSSLAAGVAFVSGIVLRRFRTFLSKKALARTSGVDPRFFV